MQRLFAQAGLLRQFLEGNPGMHEVPEHGEAFLRLAGKQGVERLCIKCAGEFFVPLYAGDDGLFIFAGESQIISL
jgi:hypothetical protein